MHKKQKWWEQSTSSIIETYWSLKFLKSLNLKLSHLCMHRCYTVAGFWPRDIFLTSPRFHLSNSSGFGITEKVRGGGEKWFIPTYTLKGCISQKTFLALYLQGTILKIQKFIEYWNSILKILLFEVLNTLFHCKTCSNFRKHFEELYHPFAAVFHFTRLHQ